MINHIWSIYHHRELTNVIDFTIQTFTVFNETKKIKKLISYCETNL